MTVAKFGTVINCMDGRTQDSVAAWLKERYRLDYVDVITEAGPDKTLAAGSKETIEGIRRKLEISVTRHGSEVVGVVGHHDCAGNPVSLDEHREHILKAVAVVRSWNYPVFVLGLWVNENWDVEVVTEK